MKVVLNMINFKQIVSPSLASSLVSLSANVRAIIVICGVLMGLTGHPV